MASWIFVKSPVPSCFTVRVAGERGEGRMQRRERKKEKGEKGKEKGKRKDFPVLKLDRVFLIFLFFNIICNLFSKSFDLRYPTTRRSPYGRDFASLNIGHRASDTGHLTPDI